MSRVRGSRFVSLPQLLGHLGGPRKQAQHRVGDRLRLLARQKVAAARYDPALGAGGEERHLALYTSETKYDSRTGWPSFSAPIEGAIRTSTDRSFFTVRTEVHCRRCGGHLGHLFEDGPTPTGLRYCMNGVALKFRRA